LGLSFFRLPVLVFFGLLRFRLILMVFVQEDLAAL